MRRRSTLKPLAVIVTITAINSVAHAAVTTVNGSLAAGAGESIVLNNSAAFAAYTGAAGVAATDNSNIGNFSNVTATAGVGTDSKILISYIDSTSSASASPNFSYSKDTYTLTSTLFSSNEVFHFYLSSFQATTGLSAVLSSGGTTVATYTNSVALPTPDGSHGYGDLTLTVNNGAVGEVLTFTGSVVSGGQNTGINAVTASAVPEPASLGLSVTGGLGLLALFRRRRP